MKFLVMFKITEGYRALTGSVVNQLQRANLEVKKQQMEQGKLLEFYYAFEGHSIVGIYECENHDELMKSIWELPAVGQLDINIYPLVDYDETFINAVFKNVEKAGTIWPGGTVKKEG